MTHPTNEEWMSFLYGELPVAKHAELQEHAATCAECGKRVEGWRATMSVLDKSVLPAPAAQPAASIVAWPRLAIAAAIVLFLGFFAGRLTNTRSQDLASLKATVTQLSAQLQEQRTAAFTNVIAAAAASASTETARLLDDYSQRLATQRTEDQESIAIALRAFDFRIDRLDSQIATVAVNTQNGFRKTQENLIALASAVPPSGESPSSSKQLQ